MNIQQILERVSQVVNSTENQVIANALGVKPQACSNWKNPKRRKSKKDYIPIHELHTFAKEQGVSLEWLLTGDKLQINAQKVKNLKFYKKGRRPLDSVKEALALERNIDFDEDLNFIFENCSNEVIAYIIDVIHFTAQKACPGKPFKVTI